MEDGIRKALFELADREAGQMKDAETEKLLLDMQDQGQVIQNEFFNVGTSRKFYQMAENIAVAAVRLMAISRVFMTREE